MPPPREGVAPPPPPPPPPPPGVASGLGVAAAPLAAPPCPRGVTPPKWPNVDSSTALSPPRSAESCAITAACAAASSSTVSPPPPPAEPSARGVRIASALGVCSYDDVSIIVLSCCASSISCDCCDALTTSESSRSPTCGGGSISRCRFWICSSSFCLLSAATASGRLVSLRFRAFSASCLRAFASIRSLRGASSFDLSTDLKPPSSCRIAASACSSSPIVSKKPAGATFWNGISVL